MTTKWDTASIQAQCCVVYGMRDLPPLDSPVSIHSSIAHHMFSYIYRRVRSLLALPHLAIPASLVFTLSEHTS